MLISTNVQVYLKTTETCQLNCKHCFTSGSSGAKIYFNPPKIIDFFKRLRNDTPWVESVHFLYHGGEPMLAPVSSLYEAYEGLKDIFPQTSFAMQTNLVYPLTQEKREFFKKVMQWGFGTSWDYDIRFGSTVDEDSDNFNTVRERQIELWENNVKILTKEDDHDLTMIVCITKRLIAEREPIDIMRYAKSLGFKYILFERITHDGNATSNMEKIPSNKEQDDWLVKMFNQCIEHKTYEWIGNMLMSEVAIAYCRRIATANRCRNCEQSLLTINADGTIAGCPNTGPKEHWGHIDWSIKDSLYAKKRLKTITCETQRNPVCYTCPAFSVCNGDCHQLPWEGDLCAAPKSIWKQMFKDNDYETYRKLILE